jgi:hypothetical protein
VPSKITVEIDPSRAGALNQAHVTVTGELDSEAYTRVANITFVCTDYPLYLPVVQRLAWSR